MKTLIGFFVTSILTTALCASNEPKKKSIDAAARIQDMRKADQSVPLTHPRVFFNRIVGGQDASEEEYPFIVALVRKNKPPETHQFCSGSLIGPQWVLTASHCVVGYKPVNGDWVKYVIKPEWVDAYVKIYDLKDTSGSRKISVTKIIPHKDYNRKTVQNDICLIKLAEPIHEVEPIKLHLSGNLDMAPNVSTVIGWGNIRPSNEEGYERPDVLQEVTMPIVPQKVCDDALHEQLPPEYGYHIFDDMLCAGLPEGGKDSCQGDSGGPLLVKQRDSYIQAGIVSWGLGCAQPNSYGVYSRIKYFNNWIKHNKK